MMKKRKDSLTGYHCDANTREIMQILNQQNNNLRLDNLALKNKQHDYSWLHKYVNPRDHILYFNPAINNSIIVYFNKTVSSRFMQYTFFGKFGVDENHDGNIATLEADISFHEKDKSLHCAIDNFVCIPCRGYGSIMMECFLKYMKFLNVKTVTGNLSTVDTEDRKDPEHGNRVRHFYKKFGFKIIEKPEGEFMKETIELDLDSDKVNTNLIFSHTDAEREVEIYRKLLMGLIESNQLKISDIPSEVRTDSFNRSLISYAIRCSRSKEYLLDVLTSLSNDLDRLKKEKKTDESTIEYLLTILECSINPPKDYEDDPQIQEFCAWADERHIAPIRRRNIEEIRENLKKEERELRESYADLYFISQAEIEADVDKLWGNISREPSEKDGCRFKPDGSYRHPLI